MQHVQKSYTVQECPDAAQKLNSGSVTTQQCSVVLIKPGTKNIKFNLCNGSHLE